MFHRTAMIWVVTLCLLSDIEIRVELRKQYRNLSDIEELGGNDGAAVQGNELSKYGSVEVKFFIEKTSGKLKIYF